MPLLVTQQHPPKVSVYNHAGVIVERSRMTPILAWLLLWSLSLLCCEPVEAI